MIFSEETGPTHFTFANQIGVQTDDDISDGSIPDELARTIQSHLWLANLEICVWYVEGSLSPICIFWPSFHAKLAFSLI